MDLYPNFIPGEKEMQIRVYAVLRGWKNAPCRYVSYRVDVILRIFDFCLVDGMNCLQNNYDNRKKKNELRVLRRCDAITPIDYLFFTDYDQTVMFLA